MSRGGRAFRSALIGGAALLLGACSPYTVRGKVIEGDTSYVAIVDESDPRLARRGVSGASVEIWSDPEKLNRKRVASQFSDAEGGFALPFDETGAGVLQYDVRITAEREGYTGAEQSMTLPSSSRRVLIMLKQGQSRTPRENESLLEQYRRYNR